MITSTGKRLLRGKMAAYGDTQADLAKYLGISLSNLNAKINAHNGAQFSLRQIQAIKARYKLTAKEVDAIFFSQVVS